MEIADQVRNDEKKFRNDDGMTMGWTKEIADQVRHDGKAQARNDEKQH
jgi:hypothetical protein